MENPVFQRRVLRWSISLITRDIIPLAVIFVCMGISLFLVCKFLSLECQAAFPITITLAYTVVHSIPTIISRLVVTGVKTDGEVFYFEHPNSMGVERKMMRVQTKFNPIDVRDIKIVSLEQVDGGFVVCVQRRNSKQQRHQLHLNRSSREWEALSSALELGDLSS